METCFFLVTSWVFWLTAKQFVHITIASIAQLAEHLLRKEKVTSSTLVGGWQFAWSSWLWRSPHTREVPSSSLGANTTIFFGPSAKNPKKHTKVCFFGSTTVYKQKHTGFMVTGRYRSVLVEEALVMIQACIKCSPHIIQTWKGVELSHTSFFKTGWEYLTSPGWGLYEPPPADTLTVQPKLLAKKTTCLKLFVTQQTQRSRGTVGFFD